MNAEKTDLNEYKHQDLSEKIIKAFYAVYNVLGYGFLEKVYENALIIELEKIGLSVRSQWPVHVLYAGRNVGEYFADLLVGDSIIVEVKAVKNCQVNMRHSC